MRYKTRDENRIQLKQANEQLNRVEFEFADHYQGSSASSNISLQVHLPSIMFVVILNVLPSLLLVCH